MRFFKTVDAMRPLPAEAPAVRVFERVCKGKDGSLLRVTFAATILGDRPFLKILSVVPCENPRTRCAAATPVLLEAPFALRASEDDLLLQGDIPSPYVSSIELFFVSQMTRAPSLA